MTKNIFILLFVLNLNSVSGQDKSKDGERIFKRNCSICHSFDKKLIATPLNDILSRRTKDWIYKYISNDEHFIKTDSIAKRVNTKDNIVTTSHHFKDEISKKEFKKLVCFLKIKQTK